MATVAEPKHENPAILHYVIIKLLSNSNIGVTFEVKQHQRNSAFKYAYIC